MPKKIFRSILFGLGFLILGLLIFFVAILLPVDRTPYKEKAFYDVMMTRLDSLSKVDIPKADEAISVGYSKINLTPAQRTATAGYGNRKGKKYDMVHDSIFVRCIVLSNGEQKAAIVSADLLIIPPTVTTLLNKRLPSIGFSLSNTYLNATHTHNSIGNWGEGAATFIYGAYDDSIVHFIADRIITSIQHAELNLQKSQLSSAQVPVGNAVRNRLARNEGTVDSLLHIIEIQREDSVKIVMTIFNAHATCLFSKDLNLSRDYPGVVVDELEASGYDFAMFLSGAVGSHACNPPEFGKPCLEWMGARLSEKALTARSMLRPIQDSTIFMARIPLALGEPQFKITKDWRVRPWVFNALLGEYTPYITALRVGKILMLGTPCDFSGELTDAVRTVGDKKQFHTIVTSFNGHYIGYITEDKYYDRSHYETQLMNWYGPGNGAYLTECLSRCAVVLTK